MYSVLLTKKAKKDLDDLEENIFGRIRNKIESLKENPRGIGSTKLTNTEVYRVRIGKYRILYEINDSRNEVVISRIKHRKDAYRG